MLALGDRKLGECILDRTVLRLVARRQQAEHARRTHETERVWPLGRYPRGSERLIVEGASAAMTTTRRQAPARIASAARATPAMNDAPPRSIPWQKSSSSPSASDR